MSSTPTSTVLGTFNSRILTEYEAEKKRKIETLESVLKPVFFVVLAQFWHNFLIFLHLTLKIKIVKVFPRNNKLNLKMLFSQKVHQLLTFIKNVIQSANWFACCFFLATNH